jgi:hypothetical protein
MSVPLHPIFIFNNAARQITNLYFHIAKNYDDKIA